MSHWKTLRETEVFADLPWIQVVKEAVELPSGRHIDNFYQLKAHDYTLIIALTRNRQLIMEQVYKHGVRRVSWMFPSGAIEPNETPLVGAQRELLEETGYVSDRWVPLGHYVQDANHKLCKGHFFFALDAHKVAEPQTNDAEDIKVLTVSLPEAWAAFEQGKIATLGAATALLFASHPRFENLLQGNAK